LGKLFAHLADLKEKLLLERVRDATAKRKIDLLEETIKDCKEYGLGDNKEVKKGEFVLRVVLQKHCELVGFFAT
jgi:hypothetical protein